MVLRILMTTVFFLSDASAGIYDERDLGKLMTSPEQRQRIDSSRRGESPSVSRNIVTSSITAHGLIKKNDGSSTVWVNGTMADDGETMDGVRVRRSGKSSDEIILDVEGKTIRLKPGQSWSDDSLTVKDNL